MLNRPISKSISRGVSISINDPNGAGFNPLSLFAAGEQGAWYDPSDLSTLYQDAAGTIPVTAASQPVGLMRDKSGRGNHATQATATSRPILQTDNGLWYLAFDGVDDWMLTGNVDFSITNKMTVWSGTRKLSDAIIGIICELSANANTNNGSFFISAPNLAAGTSYSITSRGTTSASWVGVPSPAPHTAVISTETDIAAPIVNPRINAVATTPTTTTQGTGNYGNWPLYIGMRGGTSLLFNGRLYGLIVRGVKSTYAEITQTEAWMNSKTGAY